ncbi:hypothetical protein [Aquibacillus salsiterrae]|uniref:Uncharacterized protein n=1 Tax=Aquibacillus salsiterrae TaxID=2950439 RepID=A0A9X3WJA9_9BACI|nr:hypothetical protein [Aquibacillus salsiterrae]MDC3418399.1 hypothetical protein [Aquibacillus salsiterrae]
MDNTSNRKNLIDKLVEIANKHHINYSIPEGGSDNADFADFIFKLAEDMMLGVQLAPVGSVKPLLTFPDGQELSFADLDELLLDIA